MNNLSPPVQVRQSCCVYIRFAGAKVIDFRGYPIEQLALKSNHLETAYLLIYGVLPTKEQYHKFRLEVAQHRVVHADADGFFRSFRWVIIVYPTSSPALIHKYSYDAHPMAILTSAFAYLGSYYSEANPSLQGTALLFSVTQRIK